MDLTQLHILCATARDCVSCDLAETRTQVVWGSGSETARIMLIGEAPGRNEDLGGAPFIGAAGRLLDEGLDQAGLTREDLYITNIVKCRPPQNRNPQAGEIAACERWVHAQIEAIAPQVIVTLGSVSSRWLLATTDTITSLRGKAVEVDGRTVVPTYHPAAAIYDSSKRGPLFEDLRLVRELSL